MNKEDIIKYSGVIINCRTEQEAIELLTELKAQGLTWCTGKDLLEETCWDDYKENTCYKLWKGEKGLTVTYECYEFFTKNVVTYKDYKEIS